MADSLKLEEQKALLLEELNKRTGRSFRVLPATGTTKLLKAFTVEEVGMALHELCRDRWHKDRIKELSSEYLLRATTIDKWLQRANLEKSLENRLNDEPLVTI